MRYFVPALALASLAACSGPDRQRSGSRSQDVAPEMVYESTEEPAALRQVASAPAIGPTAAPGVAFNYRHAFRLPAQQIAAVQEQHASACEKLGINRCRITGMRYRLVNQHDIEAMLSFKLDPLIARQFGKAGIDVVTRAEGLLVDSEISGVDAGSAIKAAQRSDAQLNEELRGIEAKLAARGLSPDERDRLQSEARHLRQSIRANRDSRDEHEESLATTPMVFTYGSGDLVPGFDTRSPVRQALKTAGGNFIAGASFLFVILLTLLPWLLLGGLVWALARRLVPKLARSRPREPQAEQAGAAEGA